jgi:hypothetical protein
MGQAFYDITCSAGAWRVQHDGKAENVYETKEAAFEAAIATASLAYVRSTKHARQRRQ